MISLLLIILCMIRMGADGSKPSGLNGQLTLEKTQLERNTEEKNKKVITQLDTDLGKIDVFPIMKDYKSFVNSCIDKLHSISENQYGAIFTTFNRNAFVVFVFNSIIPGMYDIYWIAQWMNTFFLFRHLSTVNKKDFHEIVNHPDFGINGDRSYEKLVKIMKKKDGIREDTELKKYLTDENKIVYFIGESPTAWNREQALASWSSDKREHTRKVVVGALRRLRSICQDTLKTDINAEDIILPTKNNNVSVGTPLNTNKNNKKLTNNSNRPQFVPQYPAVISNKNGKQNSNNKPPLPQQLYYPRGQNQQTAAPTAGGRRNCTKRRHTKKR